MIGESIGNNSVSISVSDEEADELNRIRARAARRKRRKPGHRVNDALSRRVVKLFVRYWIVLICILAAGLFVFEASRIGRKPNRGTSSGLSELKKPNPSEKGSSNKKIDGNLNRLDPTTHVVRGARERCLPLLPLEDLERLDIPEPGDSKSPVKKIVYLSEKESSYVGGRTDLHWQPINGTRFNLFTGNQTFDQREKSFQIRERVAVHCGFYSDNGGFRISDKDKGFMQTCRVVVSTCAFGGGDNLYQPIGMSNSSVHKVCYVAFWDEITLAAQESEGNKIGDDGYIGKWRIVVVRDLPFSDQRLNGKIPKILTTLL